MQKHFLYIAVVALTLLTSGAKAEVVTEQADSTRNSLALYKPIIAGGLYFTAALIVLPKVWYSDREVVPFHFNK
jgi:hypothetical protein